jgi:hypothetical protein
VALAAFLLLTVSGWWARRQQYVAFARQRLPAPSPTPLDPKDKIPSRATGLFEVQGKVQTFSELPAFFRTFATREHAVVAFSQPSRWLLLGRWPQHEVGMWYIFFRPEAIRDVAAGLLRFGHHARPALRLAIRAGKRTQTVYLSFDSDEDRGRVWADIIHDSAIGI